MNIGSNVKCMRIEEKDIKSLIDLIDYTGLSGINMCEIGSYIGESTSIFLDTGKISTITAIDPWINGYDVYDDTSSAIPFSIIEQNFDLKMLKYEKSVIKIKNYSNLVFNNFPDKYFDLVYIDGLHTYKGCLSDIINYMPKIKSTGFISGHDYGSYMFHLQGVTKAVDEYFGKPDFVFPDSSWIKKI